jgi:hypothetical protein
MAVNKLILIFLLVGGGGFAQSSDWTPIEKNQEKWLHKILRKRALDFDKITSEDLGFKSLECRLFEGPKNSEVSVFESQRLNSCLIESLRKGLKNGAYRGFVKARVQLSGANKNDDERIATFRWRPTEIGHPDAGLWAKISNFWWPVAAFNVASYIERLLMAYLSNDLIIEFNQPVRLTDFEAAPWVETLIAGNNEESQFDRLEVHTAQMEITPQNPYSMRGIIFAYKGPRKVFGVQLKMSWSLGNRKQYEIEFGSAHKKSSDSTL